MIRRVRGRATFTALAGAERHSRGPLTVRAVSLEDDAPSRVAYAVGGVRTAVARNRVRRRLRAAASACAPKLGTGVAYLVSAEPGTLTMPFEELVGRLGDLFEASRREAGAGR